jgi:hypothetical protein
MNHYQAIILALDDLGGEGTINDVNGRNIVSGSNRKDNELSYKEESICSLT